MTRQFLLQALLKEGCVHIKRYLSWRVFASLRQCAIVGLRVTKRFVFLQQSGRKTIVKGEVDLYEQREHGLLENLRTDAL